MTLIEWIDQCHRDCSEVLYLRGRQDLSEAKLIIRPMEQGPEAVWTAQYYQWQQAAALRAGVAACVGSRKAKLAKAGQ